MAMEYDDDLKLFADEDEFYDDGLNEIERRHKLERSSREAADIARDLQVRGPLYQYVQYRRKPAIVALNELVNLDPGDVAGIAAAQASVREYLMATEWIDRSVEIGSDATETIQREYRDGEEDQFGDEG
jgi:hypothetical protein